MQSVLIITGTGRCGTSALAGFLKKASPNESHKEKLGWNNKILGGYENDEVVNINRDIMNDINVSDEKIKQVDYKWAKDPRFTFDNVLNTWLNVRKDLKFLLVFRNINNTMKGFRRHPYHFKRIATFTDKELKCEIEKRLSNFFSAMIEYNVEYKCLHFPEYINNYDGAIRILNDFGQLNIDEEKGRKVWQDHMDINKVHYR